MAPTRVRWRIITMLTIIMGVTTLCRLNLSVAGNSIQDEFGFSTITMGWTFSAFLAGYAPFQIPWGALGDSYSPCRILVTSILFWSGCTAAMGFAPHLAVRGASVLLFFMAIRFLTGVGEPAISPNVTRCVASWASVRERGLANGLAIGGLGLGGALTPILIT